MIRKLMLMLRVKNHHFVIKPEANFSATLASYLIFILMLLVKKSRTKKLLIQYHVMCSKWTIKRRKESRKIETLKKIEASTKRKEGKKHFWGKIHECLSAKPILAEREIFEIEYSLYVSRCEREESLFHWKRRKESKKQEPPKPFFSPSTNIRTHIFSLV